MQVFEYDELEFRRLPNPREHMTNIWGYSHINFFGPMSRWVGGRGGGVEGAGWGRRGWEGGHSHMLLP